MDIYQIIKEPVITEKSSSRGENRVAFWVDIKTNKSEIRKAVEKIFNVKVLDVNTMKVPGKWKRVGRTMGKLPARKKAYVTLREGDKIGLFEGT
ncbi:MAG: 50S ribosomal protein L23 [Deltaproteobacteria bacterium]|nr:50S ribosomal protein L23 [Deltaproteobacteria bacterium]